MRCSPGSAKDANHFGLRPAFVLPGDFVLDASVLAIANVEFVFGDGLSKAGGNDKFIVHFYKELALPPA